MEEEGKYMTVSAAARALGITRTTIYALAKRGELRIQRDPVYLHGPTKIPVEDVERLIARRHADPPA